MHDPDETPCDCDETPFDGGCKMRRIGAALDCIDTRLADRGPGWTALRPSTG
jgi:hypothetical protein